MGQRWKKEYILRSYSKHKVSSTGLNTMGVIFLQSVVNFSTKRWIYNGHQPLSIIPESHTWSVHYSLLTATLYNNYLLT